MKHLTLFSFVLLVGLAAFAADESAEHTGDTTTSKKSRKFKEDSEINQPTKDLGQKLFFGELSGAPGDFKARYETFAFGGKKLHEAINEIKPRKEGDEAPTVDQEMPIAKAIADMFDEMTDKQAPKVFAEIEKMKNRIDKKPTSDSQYDEFVKRLYEAALMKIPDELIPEKSLKAAKKDERLAAFREAFKEARDEALKVAKEKNELLKQAAEGNKLAQAKLFGDKTDKTDLEKNKFAVGTNIGNFIANRFNESPQKGIEAVKALSSKDDKGAWRMSFNNGDGKPVFMELPKLDPKNADQFTKLFQDPKVASSQFVGHEHDVNSKPVTWEYDPTKGEVVKKAPPQVQPVGSGNAAPPQSVAAKSADAVGANPGTGGTGGSSGGSGSAAQGATSFSNSCSRCHASMPISSPEAAAKAMASGRMPKGGPTLSASEQANIVAFLRSK